MPEEPAQPQPVEIDSTVMTADALSLGTIADDHVLYVIFHGSIALYDDPALPWIDAFISDRKDHHSYLCGRFLSEVRIPRGSELALSGVIPGRALFKGVGNKYLHFTGTRAAPGARISLDQVYSRLRFPRPSAIFVPSFGVNTTNKTDQDGNSLNGTILPMVTVFQYAFGNLSDLRLDMYLNCALSFPPGECDQTNVFPGWKPLDSDPRPLSLHIRAEEEFSPAMVSADFKAVSAIIGDGDPGKSATDWLPQPGQSLPSFSKSRFDWEVTLSLANRIAWFGGRLATAIAANSPGPDDKFLVQAPSDFKDRDVNCGQRSAGPA